MIFDLWSLVNFSLAAKHVCVNTPSFFVCLALLLLVFCVCIRMIFCYHHHTYIIIINKIDSGTKIFTECSTKHHTNHHHYLYNQPLNLNLTKHNNHLSLPPHLGHIQVPCKYREMCGMFCNRRMFYCQDKCKI